MKTPIVIDRNDVVRIEVKVNGNVYYIAEKICNTQADLIRFQNEVHKIMSNFHLIDLSRFK